MRFDHSLKQDLMAEYNTVLKNMPKVAAILAATPDHVSIRSFGGTFDSPMGEHRQDFELEALEFSTTITWLPHAQTVVFSQEQATVFADMPGRYFDGLDFRLPFKVTFLQFTEPLPLTVDGQPDGLIALLLHQHPVGRESWQKAKVHTDLARHFGSTLFVKEPPAWDISQTNLIAIFADHNIRMLSWYTDLEKETFFERTDNEQRMAEWNHIRNIAIACVGFINAENVTLQRMEGASEKVNKKRARAGKRQIEPYYITKIRGVAYTSAGEPLEPSTSTGRHVSFRFDVRGHFRRLRTGKVTWVNSHQRGVAHDLYVPKVYVMED